jgi:UDP-GlcNAc:undecaprenyl-phosphate/decaprenyl-phosphate GlcNAc-1-phosphate transferase
MLPFLFSLLIGFVVSLVTLPIIIRYANKKKLLVKLEQRKIHKKVTPSMGGIAIFFGLVSAAIVYSISFNSQKILLITGVLVIPFLIGFLDDRIHLRPSRKLIGQFVAATLVYLILDVKLTSFYGVFGEFQFPGWVGYFITVLTIILLTNSFNLIDGIDGLAGMFSMVALLFFGIWFAANGINEYAVVSFGLIGSVLAFLIMNWQPSKIFMGDTGSLVLGMLLSILAIVFLNENSQLATHHSLKFNSGVGSVLCVLIVPVVDTIRVLIIRIGRGLSPLTADKRHIHHALVRIGKSHRFAVLLILVVHIFFVANALLLKQSSDWYVIGSLTLFASGFCFILEKAIARHTYAKKAHGPLLPLKEQESVLKM